MRARLFLGLLTALAPFLAAGSAIAQPAQPLDRLLPQIRRNVPGQFLDAEGATTGGNPHYHLKWLTPDGRVMWLDADARTGRVLGQSPGRDNFDGQRGHGDEQAAPPDRRDEGRSTNPRDQDEDRRAYRQPPDASARQRFDGNGGGDRYRGGQQQYGRFGGGRGVGGGPSGGNNGRFGGAGGGNGGGRDRRGNGH